MSGEPLRTPRLDGTPPTEADWLDWRALLLDARVAATIGGVPPEAVARARFEADIRHWSEHGFGQWAWRARDGAFAGRGGLRHYEIEGEAVIELGYSVVADRWGNGLATEMATASVGFGFSAVGLERIHAFAFAGNDASVRVLAKCGFTHVGPMRHAGHPCVLYALSRPPRP